MQNNCSIVDSIFRNCELFLEQVETTSAATESALKLEVRQFWNSAPCGEVYAAGAGAGKLDRHARTRYALEPYIFDFARFPDGTGKRVLEVGVGMGADHLEWAKSRPRTLSGIDLTPRAIELTRSRLAQNGFQSGLRVADAEALPFPDNSFDLVYSWGVIHHSPDTPRAVREIHRVLAPQGTARVMIYHRSSLVGYMLWLRYALMTGRIATGLDEIYAKHLESPGTKAYSVSATREMFSAFRAASIRVQLSFGDLLTGAAGQRHQGFLLSAARALWPRWFIQRTLQDHGLYLLIEARK